MITKIPVTPQNQSGEFYSIMIEDNWYICDTIQEVGNLLVDNGLGRSDVGASVSKMMLKMLPRFEQGQVCAQLESIAFQNDIKKGQ